MHVYREGEVCYSRLPGLGWKKFRYTWFHISTGKSGDDDRIVYCRNESDFLRLLTWWTRGDWVYYPVFETPIHKAVHALLT